MERSLDWAVGRSRIGKHASSAAYQYNVRLESVRETEIVDNEWGFVSSMC